MAFSTNFLSTWKLRTTSVLFLVIILLTAAQNEQQTCSAEGVCGPTGGNGQQQQAHQQQFHPHQFQQQQQQLTQQQQQQQQQKQDSPHYIVETINIEFGEPQVVMNHATDMTRLNIQHTQQYISMYPSWKSTCLNRHQLCSFWAANGECLVNTWMKDNCAPSCQFCPRPDAGPRGQKDDKNLNNDATESSTSSLWDNHISVAIPFGEPQVVPIVNADPIVQSIAKMLSYMQQQVYVEEKYAKVREECKCKDHRCAAWASEGECVCMCERLFFICCRVVGNVSVISWVYCIRVRPLFM
jgi:hypothetical protein